jgi:hypothetical protein
MMATARASLPKPPGRSKPAQDRRGLPRADPERGGGAIAAAIEIVRAVESRREMTRLEREARWACEWWPPD